MDFRDANGNGVDDRDEKSDRNRRYIKGQDPSTNNGAGQQTGPDANQQSADLNQMYRGIGVGYDMMRDLFSNGGTEDDDGRRAMRDAFQFDMASKFMNTQLGMAQSEFNLAQNKEGMAYANMLDRQTMQESRNHIFGLNMQTMDKQFELNNEYADRDFSRNLGMLAATGEQTRKNYAAEGQQQRLGTIVAGEQQRLGIQAQGDQTRQNIDAQGLQDRLGYETQGQQQRLGYKVQGEEQRKGIRTQGSEQRKNIAATGAQNRLQAVTEGEQQRLNIGKTAEEERTTMSHSDNIAAGREKRQTAAARAGARAF